MPNPINATHNKDFAKYGADEYHPLIFESIELCTEAMQDSLRYPFPSGHYPVTTMMQMGIYYLPGIDYFELSSIYLKGKMRALILVKGELKHL